MRSPRFHYCQPLDGLSLPEAAATMLYQPDCLAIDQVNWPTPTSFMPSTHVRLAYSDQALYVLFTVNDNRVKALQTQPQSAVCQDSCVEFFMRLPDKNEYWNFEFNAIGTANASRRERRDYPTRLTENQLATIGRWSSLGTSPFDELPGDIQWSLLVRIPFTLIGIDINHLPALLYANFYKCGDHTAHPHYLSWAPVHSDRPNFHRPDDFSPITFSVP